MNLVAGLKRRLPWWSRIATKIVLSRLPAGYGLWQRIGLFRHGEMDRTGYALEVFDRHVASAGLQGSLKGRTILELGPGDSIATAIIAAASGARAILVDTGRFARESVDVDIELVRNLRARGWNPPRLDGCRTLEEVLAATGAQYFTDGLASLKTLPAHSVDFIYSHAVLEHVRKAEFLATQRECARILCSGGICSHRVDLRDHLGGGLNNLRFTESVWESDFFVRSGFYTNRIRFGRMLELFGQAGFSAEVGAVDRWNELPIARRKLDGDFRDVPDHDLRVWAFDVTLRHAVEAGK